jgi:uncharacterized membrane protein
LDAAIADSIPLTFLSRDSSWSLDNLNISAQSKARITEAIDRGYMVIVPTRDVTVQGVTTTAWYEINPETGETIGVLQDGSRGALDTLVSFAFFVGLIVYLKYEEAGTAASLFGEEAIIVANISPVTNKQAKEDARKLLGHIEQQAQMLRDASYAGPGVVQHFNNLFYPKLYKAIFILIHRSGQDPPIVPSLLYETTNPVPSGPAAVHGNPILAPASTDGIAQVYGIAVLNQIEASWATRTDTTFQATSLMTQYGATLEDVSGNVLGSGLVEMSAVTETNLSISGNAAYSLSGQGSLSSYRAGGNGLSVSGKWDNYSAAVTGSLSITLSVPDGALTLNGKQLPVGKYIITTNAATLSGSGTMSAPNFAGSASITATNGTINLGPGSGRLSVGGKPLDPSNETTLDGYSGTINVSANGDGTDSVALIGNAGNVLQVVVSPSPQTSPAGGGGGFVIDQNTPVTFAANVETSFADTYNLTANAPPGWTVTIDGKGNVTATSAPGLQSGTYPIQIIAQSQTNANLVAQTTVEVTITPTKPGMKLTVASDPLFTVPYNGAQLPTAFRATIQNLGPSADTYNLTFSNIPSGFTLLNSGSSDTVPAGQTGVLGLYLQPNAGQPLPAPGTVLSFGVTARSTTDPTITKTQTVSFTMPVIHAVTLVSETPTQDVVPGTGWSFIVDIRNDGNVTEIVHPTASVPTGLDLPGGFFSQSLYDSTLAPGQSVSETADYGAAASVPLNSTQTVTVTASYGPADEALSQTVQMSVQMILPGAYYAGNLGVVAAQLGRTDLANRLGDLSTALTSLFMDPSSAVAKSQALGDLDSVIAQLANDPFLAGYVNNLSEARGSLAGATTADQVQGASNQIGGDLNFAWVLPDEAKHSVTLALSPNSAVAQPQAPVYYDVVLQNTGTQTTTYDFSVHNNTTGLSFAFSQPSITLAPGQASAGGPGGVTLAVTESGNSLIAGGFDVQATAEGASEIAPIAHGSVTVRPAFVSVPEVDARPSFVQPGNPVHVTAMVLNAVNQEEPALVSYAVVDTNGKTVFTSQLVPLTLTVQTSLAAVDMGSLDTTGLATGSYALNVTVTDTSGKPIPGATGAGTVCVGTPVTASLTASPTSTLPGSPTVTNTLRVTAQTPFPTPLTLVGQVQTTPVAGSVALVGNLAYVAGTNGIDIVDVSNPAAPVEKGTFGSDLIVKGGTTIVRLVGNELIVGSDALLNPTSFTLLIYNLADPLHPQLVSQTPIDYVFISDLLIHGDTILVPTTGGDYFAGVFSFQFGSVVSLDVSNPAKPVLDQVLFNDRGNPDGGDTNQDGGAIVSDHIAYFASSTSAGVSRSGVGRVLVVDDSDPKNLSVLGEVDIPGTSHATGVAIQGDQALVFGNTGDWANADPPGSLTGTLTLSVLDISDPANPKLVGSTLFTDGTGGGHPVPLRNGLFAISQTSADGKPQLLVVDPSDPAHIVVTAISTPAAVNEMAVSGDLLYTTSSSGLGIYRVGSVVGEPVTISVQVPTTTGVAVVPGSFNIPPTQITQGVGVETLVWDRELAFGESQPSFTWQSTVTNLLPGEAREVTQGGTVSFVSQGTVGTLTLPPTVVSGVHFIGMAPASQTVRPGETVTFHVTVDNPTSFNQTFFLSVTGVPGGWVSLQPAAVVITGNSSASAVLEFTPNATAELGDYGFQVKATYGFGDPSFIGLGVDTVQGTLVVAGQADVPSYLEAHGVVASLKPVQPTAGQGTSASYAVHLINTGSADDTFSLTAAGLPAGVSATFGQSTIDVPPGTSNFRDDPLSLKVAAGTAPGRYPFTVTATSTSDPSVSNSTSGSLIVTADGVQVKLNPPTGAPGSGFEMTVTNTGTTADTYKLTLGGPAALVGTLGTNQVTLAAGASQVVPIRTGAVDFAVPGTLDLVGAATSQASPAVRDADMAALTIPATVGMTATFDPTSKPVATLGTTSFLLMVQNTGNTEDAYSATIIGANGPITANLVGLDGTPTQSIPIFRLPGLSTGAILVQAKVVEYGVGTVTVRVTSLNHPDITATATATVTLSPQKWIVLPPPPPPPPPADGPKITLLQRFGIHRMPTTLVLHFDQPLDPALAQDVREYRLVDAQGRVVPITAADYDPVDDSVTLHLKRRINFHHRFKLTVKGTSPDGLTDAQGILLDGDGNGHPGSNYVTTVDRRSLVPPDPAKKLAHRDLRHAPSRRGAFPPAGPHPSSRSNENSTVRNWERMDGREGRKASTAASHEDKTRRRDRVSRHGNSDLLSLA